jgi:plasmid stabilization system protein ParE
MATARCTRPANNDLAQISDFIANDNPEAALHWLSETQDPALRAESRRRMVATFIDY